MPEIDLEWLRIRESYDHRSRAEDLIRQLNTFYEDRRAIRIMDLSCGTGGNFRYLAPRLRGNQTWLLQDHSTLLLNKTLETTEAWALQNGFRFTATSDRFFYLETGEAAINCALKLESLEDNLENLPWANHDVITASALLDHTSQEWLANLFRILEKLDLAFLFALHYNGMMVWQPAHPLDARITTAFNRFMRSDRGMGALLGDRAPSVATRIAEQSHFEISQSRSDWNLTEKDGDLIIRQIQYIEEAARRMIDQDSLEILDNWSSQKKYEARGGRCRLTVGHTDILGLPVRGLFGG